MSDEGLNDGDRDHSTSLYPPACHTSEFHPTFKLSWKKKTNLSFCLKNLSNHSDRIVLLSLSFLFFWSQCMACGILVPQSGLNPAPLAVEAQSLTHQTTREVLILVISTAPFHEACQHRPQGCTLRITLALSKGLSQTLPLTTSIRNILRPI